MNYSWKHLQSQRVNFTTGELLACLRLVERHPWYFSFSCLYRLWMAQAGFFKAYCNMPPSFCHKTVKSLIMTDGCSPSVTAGYFTSMRSSVKASYATTSNPNQCDIQIQLLAAIMFPYTGHTKDTWNVMYDMPGVLYYLMRNALEINTVSWTVVVTKAPWNSIWHFS